MATVAHRQARSARIGRGAAAAVVGPYVGSAWQRAAYASSPRPSSPDAPIVVVDVESNMIDFNDPSFEVHCAVTMDVTGNTVRRLGVCVCVCVCVLAPSSPSRRLHLSADLLLRPWLPVDAVGQECSSLAVQ